MATSGTFTIDSSNSTVTSHPSLSIEGSKGFAFALLAQAVLKPPANKSQDLQELLRDRDSVFYVNISDILSTEMAKLLNQSSLHRIKIDVALLYPDLALNSIQSAGIEGDTLYNLLQDTKLIDVEVIEFFVDMIAKSKTLEKLASAVRGKGIEDLIVRSAIAFLYTKI